MGVREAGLCCMSCHGPCLHIVASALNLQSRKGKGCFVEAQISVYVFADRAALASGCACMQRLSVLQHLQGLLRVVHACEQHLHHGSKGRMVLPGQGSFKPSIGLLLA